MLHGIGDRREAVDAAALGSTKIRVVCPPHLVSKWRREALKESHGDEKPYHNEVIANLQKDYQKLQDRIDAMYVNKLDGKVSQEFFDRKNGDWRAEQAEILRKIEKHQSANFSCLDKGTRLLELAQKAASLYEKQEMN